MNHRDKLGWIGTGRMGSVLAGRLLAQGVDLTVYNRTRSKAEPLAREGARIVDHPADLADRDIVIISVAGSNDFADVIVGPQGLFRDPGRIPKLVVDTSTVSMEVSSEIRRKGSELGAALLAAPVSGNPKVARAGKLSLAASGPREAYDAAR